jgi:hypothetical protein
LRRLFELVLRRCLVGQGFPRTRSRCRQDQREGKGPGVSQLSSWPATTSFRVVPHLSSAFNSFHHRLSFRIKAIQQDFFLPSESYDLIFLKARIAILCTKGFEIMDLSELVIVTRHLIYRSVADVLSTVSRVLLFRNGTTRAMRSSLNGASHVVPWACSAPARTSSFFATMVRASSGTLTIYLLTPHRIRVVCEPPWRP